MPRKNTLLLLAALLVPSVLSACTSFTPVYGGGSSAAQNIRFNFASPDSRLEQVIFNRLSLAFPGEAGPQDPVLDIVATTGAPQGAQSDAFAVARPVNVRVEATVTVSQGEQVKFTTTRFADTAYQGGKLTPVDLASRAGAEEATAKALADALRIAILAGYRP